MERNKSREDAPKTKIKIFLRIFGLEGNRTNKIFEKSSNFTKKKTYFLQGNFNDIFCQEREGNLCEGGPIKKKFSRRWPKNHVSKTIKKIFL